MPKKLISFLTQNNLLCLQTETDDWTMIFATRHKPSLESGIHPLSKSADGMIESIEQTVSEKDNLCLHSGSNSDVDSCEDSFCSSNNSGYDASDSEEYSPKPSSPLNHHVWESNSDPGTNLSHFHKRQASIKTFQKEFRKHCELVHNYNALVDEDLKLKPQDSTKKPYTSQELTKKAINLKALNQNLELKIRDQYCIQKQFEALSTQQKLIQQLNQVDPDNIPINTVYTGEERTKGLISDEFDEKGHSLTTMPQLIHELQNFNKYLRLRIESEKSRENCCNKLLSYFYSSS